jgi:hypothetical protein
LKQEVVSSRGDQSTQNIGGKTLKHSAHQPMASKYHQVSRIMNNKQAMAKIKYHPLMELVADTFARHLVLLHQHHNQQADQ